MSAGRSVILRAGGQIVAFLIEKKLKITANPREITNDDSAGFRTYADTASTYTAKIDLKGNAKTEWMRNAGLSPGVQVTLFNIELNFTGGNTITGSFYVAAFTEGGESGASRELTLTLESTGQWELTTGTGEQIVGITFGQYPWLATSSFAVSAAVESILVKAIPQPDIEQFGVAASIKSIGMPVTANYVTAETGAEEFGVAASIKSISMPVTANYVTAETGAEDFGVAASIKSISMPVTANYAEHEIHDKEQFGISASIKSITMRTV
jgi:hypothetical protein